MNYLDGIIIIFILLCAIVGSQRGVIKEGVNVIGTILLILLSFTLMGPVSSLFYKFFPFFSFGLVGINLSALNILVYQIVSFAVVFFVLNIILNIILSITNIVDKLINLLVLVKPISALLGGIVGIISGYVVAFIILLILSVPFSASKTFHDSKINNFILDKTPIFTPLTSDIRNATNDIYNLTIKIANDTNSLNNVNIYNLEMLDIMLKYNIVSVETVDDLILQNKLGDIKNLNQILNQYR